MTVGCVAGDEESYEVFKDLFDPIISDRHGGYKPTDRHPTDMNFENLKGGDDLDPAYVLSSRVRTGRSIKGYTLPPHTSRGERRAIERLSVEALTPLEGEFKGKYYPLKSMTDAEQDQLILLGISHGLQGVVLSLELTLQGGQSLNRQPLDSSALTTAGVGGEGVSLDAAASTHTAGQHIGGVQIITTLQVLEVHVGGVLVGGLVSTMTV